MKVGFYLDPLNYESHTVFLKVFVVFHKIVFLISSGDSDSIPQAVSTDGAGSLFTRPNISDKKEDPEKGNTKNISLK